MTVSTVLPPGSPGFERLAAARAVELAGSAPTFDARLFARLVAAREVRGELALLGLTSGQLTSLTQRHFCADVALSLGQSAAQIPAVTAEDTRTAYAASMRAFLIAHASAEVDGEDVRCLASIVAHACLRPDHLWRDLGLSGRDDVTAMLERYFPELVARNVEGLRWKKLLARELALATGAVPGPAPGCPGCEDFGFCFPPAP
jgi:nitrogen fixation protein NifQ